MDNAMRWPSACGLALWLGFAAACSSSEAPNPKGPPEAAAAEPGEAALADAAPGTKAEPAQPIAPTDTPAAEPTAPSGKDFISQARILFRVAACGGDDPLPENVGAKVVARHCREMQRSYKRYRDKFAIQAAAFIAGLRPADLPTRVVYPFGGGDLSSALVTYPDALEITTISLEASGDPRTVDGLTRKQFKADVGAVGHDIRRLLRNTHSTTKSLQDASHSKMPGTVAFALTALAIHGFEPVSLHYFAFEKDGSLRYLTDENIAQLEEQFGEHSRAMAEKERELRKAKLQVWKQQIAVFANMELRFRKLNGGDEAPVRVYRHIVANLDNPHLADDPRVLLHLQKKGKVAAMTKAASYLLWMDEFSTIRNYLLENMTWMISDSSGIPPSLSAPAGFEVIPYGKFDGPYFYYKGRTSTKLRKELGKLWKSSPGKNLPFCYGYPDVTRKGFHLMVTQPREDTP